MHRRYLPAFFIIGVIFVTILALMPGASIPPVFLFWDKAQHALAYTVLSITGFFTFPQRVKLVSIALIAHGAVIEIMQILLTTTRFGDIFDWLADGVGILIGVIVYILLPPAIKGKAGH